MSDSSGNNKPESSEAMTQTPLKEQENGQETHIHAEPADNPESPNKIDPVRRMTLTVLTVCGLLFVWYLFADRYAPFTDQARVQGFVVPIVPQVSGTVVKVDTGLNQIVKQDQVLVQIDPQDYELAVSQAEADLKKAEQEIGAGAAQVSAASTDLTDSEAKLAQA